MGAAAASFGIHSWPMRRLWIAAVAVAAACGGSSPSAPSTPVPPLSTTPVAPAVPAPLALTGHVVDTVTGQPLPGVAMTIGSASTTSDAAGAFRVEFPGAIAGMAAWVSLSSPSIVMRWARVSVGTRDITLDAIVPGNGFDLSYYRELARDGYELPNALQPIERWTKAPHVYLKTVDEAGRPIEAATLEPVAAALVDDAAAWTGGRFGIADVERGTDTREGVSGWITVKWPAAPDPTLCGRAEVATDGGWIELYYLTHGCSCLDSRIAPGIVRHELGHAMGFWHTEYRDDVLYGGGYSDEQCDRHPSARERLHAAVAYDRPPGNYDPDTDPMTAVQSHRAPIIVNN